MNHSSRPRPNLEKDLPPWQEQAAQIQLLVEEQFRQIDELLDRYDSLVTGNDGLADGWALLEQSRQEFETHCQKVTDEIEQEYQQLATGWERLEALQRQLEAASLTSASGPRPLIGPSALPTPAPAALDSPARINPSQPLDEHATPVLPTPPDKGVPRNLDIRDNWSPQLSGSTVLQFEQMKRQIQKHSGEARHK
jgi:hypothetical protein